MDPLSRPTSSSAISPPPVINNASINAENIAPRRRNGRPQACEPCRKRKTACDHTLPVCSRCKRRSTTQACVYLNSPVAYARNAAAVAQSSSAANGESSSQFSDPIESNLPRSSSRRDGITPARRASSTNDIHKRMRPAADLFGSHNGYLGETSFSAIFKENRANLDALPTPSSSLAVSPEDGHLEEMLVPDHILRMGVKTLNSVPDRATGKILLLDRMFTTNPAGWTKYDAWAGLAGAKVMNSVWDVWDRDTGIRIGHNHEEVVKFLCKNTAKSLEDEDDPERWRDSFSGRNMRWETLGLFFSFWAYGALASKNSDPHISSQIPPRNDHRTYMLELMEAGNTCIMICNALETSNPLFVYLLLMHRFLESLVEGDASPTLWRRHGELVAVALSVGLHRVADSRITLSLEWRRRVWARVFSATQTVSSFMGRPPLISRRYSLTALPMDLDDVELMSDPETLQNAISRLDANGWDTRGNLHGVTLSRARMMLAMIKDEIMEMALGVSTTNDSLQQAQLIKQRLYAYDAQIPYILRWDARDILSEDITPSSLGGRLIQRLEYLSSHFMLERLVNKQTQANAQVLVDLSRELLSVTLNLFKHPERFQSLKADFEWLIMTHAVPASGVLCLGLLQQRFNNTAGSGSIATLPRAEVIQDLSVFVAFLDWVKPNAPNAELCYRIREIVGKVLNQALEPQMAEPVSAMDGTGNTVPLYNFELPDNFLGFEEFGNFDLMDTYDWVG